MNGLYKCTPAPEYLLKINSHSPELSAQRKDQYHGTTVKKLWLSQGTRPDIQLATEFHYTRAYRRVLGKAKTFTWFPLKNKIYEIDDSENVVIYVDGA